MRCSLELEQNTNRKELEIGLRVPADKEEYVLITKIVDEETCNPLRLWHDLGEPSSLSEKQKKLLREAANPLITSSRVCPDSRNAEIKLNIRNMVWCILNWHLW